MSALILAKEFLILSPDNEMLMYLAEKKLHIDVEELLKDEELMKFFSSKAPKKKTSGLERARALSEFNEEKCQALIWQKADPEDLKGTGYNAGNTGYAVQCNTAPVEDGCFCKRCSKKSNPTPYGKVGERIPVDEDHSIVINEKTFFVLNNENGKIFNVTDLPERRKKSSGRPKKSDDQKDRIIKDLEAQLAGLAKKDDDSDHEIAQEDEVVEVVEVVGEHEAAADGQSGAAADESNFQVVSGNEKDGGILLYTENGIEYRFDEDGLVYSRDDEDLEDPVGTYDWERRQVDM